MAEPYVCSYKINFDKSKHASDRIQFNFGQVFQDGSHYKGSFKENQESKQL